MKIINQHQIPFDPTTELAGLVLIREALTQNLLETGPIQEPLLLIAKLEANPRLAMSLMTESEPGVQFEMELSENLPEAAAQILEEIVASLRATVPPMLP
jgi:hypothetical protein